MSELFGTNGVRGIVNEDMNTDLALRLGKAIGTWIGKNKTVAVGTDTRVSNQMLKNAVSSALMATGNDVIDLGEVPTPAIQYYTRKNTDLGIAITASHNPPEFNGIKCINGDGTELIGDMEEEIEELYFSKNFELVEWNEVGQRTSDDPLELYKKAIKKKIDIKAIKEDEPKVVIDCANGAGCCLSPYLLRELGCDVVSLNAQPDGSFPGHESEPTKENLKDLIRLTKETDADLGIAHDGDADRAIFIDENGEFIHGDKILTLIAKEMVQEKGGGTVVTPVSSSSSVEDVVRENGGNLIYTAVGSPIVARVMKKEEAIFGGEENGGLIFADHQYCRDAAMTASKIVEMIVKEDRLSSLLEDLPDYILKKRGVECPDDLKVRLLEEVKKEFEDEDYDDTDGLKIYYDEGWVLIRPSGTEPKYRVYCEAQDEEKAEMLVSEHQDRVREILKELR
ncbi:MAG: phosphoglucosamine mutase [Candidatus Thermoplasmatota archaeon]|nr:phosphoglucosamine mutase [Candidatus Thermoplasmatota archaeon]